MSNNAIVSNDQKTQSTDNPIKPPAGDINVDERKKEEDKKRRRKIIVFGVFLSIILIIIIIIFIVDAIDSSKSSSSNITENRIYTNNQHQGTPRTIRRPRISRRR
jgi:uncharacterized membrane protein YvbJ